MLRAACGGVGRRARAGVDGVIDNKPSCHQNDMTSNVETQVQ